MWLVPSRWPHLLVSQLVTRQPSRNEQDTCIGHAQCCPSQDLRRCRGRNRYLPMHRKEHGADLSRFLRRSQPDTPTSSPVGAANWWTADIRSCAIRPSHPQRHTASGAWHCRIPAHSPAPLQCVTWDVGPRQLAARRMTRPLPMWARMLSAVLETTRADVNAAAFAQEAGEDRRITLSRTAVRLSEQHLGELTAGIDQLLAAAREHPDQDGCGPPSCGPRSTGKTAGYEPRVAEARGRRPAAGQHERSSNHHAPQPEPGLRRRPPPQRARHHLPRQDHPRQAAAPAGHQRRRRAGLTDGWQARQLRWSWRTGWRCPVGRRERSGSCTCEGPSPGVRLRMQGREVEGVDDHEDNRYLLANR